MVAARGGGVPFPRSTLLPSDAYANREAAFHVTVAAHPKVGHFAEPVALAIWREIVAQPEFGRVQLHAACLMPDHVHMLLQPATQDIHAFVGRWKSHTTRRAWAAGNQGPLWQPKMWDRTIRNEEDFASTISYIIENPVQAGLVSDWEAPWTWLPAKEPRPSVGA